ncbi:TetR/AcrR family transcriptional regulator [Paludisphaera mucosa]|uniref:TetR/AcrR family transcriptional regulator n=1 Tax=Paludisphaera mucosa TaxID=3030827 RepID=A0ABT6FEU3_9BACT|nr:TetR/AcrR family transcriptional regulator [Paludisphaera mucosa]MDG3006097.1 TetR/AcrR family transcriptional regulator [Paludisphaera mucosa]
MEPRRMGRPRKFTREDVLARALPVFWERGFADAAVHELEKATGVNKSGLYSEFPSKEALFLACLRHYYEVRNGAAILAAEPLGWANIEAFLKAGLTCPGGSKGCFAINSMREFAILPAEARQIVAENAGRLKGLLEFNVRAAGTKADPAAVAELISTFFSGICVEQNLEEPKARALRKIDDLMALLRAD